MKKVILLLSLSFFISGCTLIPKLNNQQNDNINVNGVTKTNTNQPIVGQKTGTEEHKCWTIGDGGAWCESEQKCYDTFSKNIEDACLSLKQRALVNETKDWKTYANTQFKFSFRYPTTWKIMEHQYIADEPLSYNGVTVSDPGGVMGSFSVCPENRGNDCIPFQDAQWNSTISNIVILAHPGIKNSYTIKSADCFSCTPRSTITLSTKPSGWSEGRDFLLVSGLNKSLSIPEKILSTISFTDEAKSYPDVY
jgi:hypothetical protein